MSITLPLTTAQKGIWLGQQKLIHSASYNTAEMLFFDGDIELEKLICAVAQVLQHTAALNMVLAYSANELVQKYLKNNAHENSSADKIMTSDILPYNLQQFPPTSRARPDQLYRFSDQQTLREWQNYWLNELLDLTEDRPFRHALIQTDKGGYAWYLQIHHIACDGFSYALISNTLKQAYEGTLTTSEQQALEDFQTLISNSEAYETSEQTLRDENYWQTQFNRHNPLSFKAAELGESQPAVADRVRLNLKIDFYRVLKNQAAPLNNDWPALLQAVLAKWVQISTGLNRVTFGCPIMNRPFGSVMRTPGLQMNILPLTVSISATDSIFELATRIQEIHKSHKIHANYRYEYFPALIKSLAKQSATTERTTTKRSFGPMINILPFDRSLSIGTAHVRVKSLAAGPVEDIALYFSLNDRQQLDGFVEFHPDLYQPDERQQLSDNLSHWLNKDAFLDKSTAAIELYRSTIRSPLRVNRAGPPWSLFELLDHQRKTQGEKVALRWFDQTQTKAQWQNMNYQTLCTYIADTAQTFAQAGVHRGHRCIIATDRDPWSIIAMFACLALNAEFIGIDSEGPSTRLQTIINDCKPKLAFIHHGEWLHQKGIVLAPDTCQLTKTQVANLAMRSKIAAASALQVFCQQQRPDALAYGIYTSGSTGQPKAVEITQQALVQFIHSANKIYQMSSQDHVLQFAPLHFDACIEEIFVSLGHGATLSLRPSNMIDNFTVFNQTIEDLKITLLDLPTALWHEWVRFNAQNNIPLPNTVTRVIIGGEACKPSAIDDFFAVPHNAKLVNTYGPSEATVVATAKVITRCNHREVHPLSIGSPLPGRSVYVLDHQLNPLPKGLIGQLALAGDSLAEGYFAQPELTARKFINLNQHERVYLTGDRAAISPLNEVLFYGRTDDEIKISGQRIHPAEIMTAMEQVLADYQVAIITPKYADQYRIFAVLAHERHDQFDQFPDALNLKRQLTQKLPAVQIPSQFFVTAKLPLTRAGKIDRNHLEMAINQYFPSSVDSTSTDQTNKTENLENTENADLLNKVLSVWQDVLGNKNIRANDDFFVLGGTSMQLLQVATRLGEVLYSANNSHDIKVSDLFKYPRASDLANALGNSKTASLLSSDAPPKPFFPPDLAPELRIKFRQQAQPKPAEHLLLTGATGFVGTHILSNLLKLKTKVTCIIRASTENEAREKLAVACKSQGLMDISADRSVVIVLGDLTLTNWGLTDQQLNCLAKPLTGIVHNGAVTSIVRDYQSLVAVNVNATQTALQLAHFARAPIHYISTIAIADHSILPEEFIDAHTDLLDGYQQSKWAAENLIQQRSQFDQPYSIYRLPRVVGDPSTGVINPRDLIWKIVAASERALCLPILELEEPWLAVNEVARLVSEGVLKNRLGIYNCVPPQNVSVQQLLNEVTETCHIRQIPLEDWLTALSHSANSEDQSLRAFFIGMGADNGARLPTIQQKRFVQIAQANALRPPTFDSYIRQALRQKIIVRRNKTQSDAIITRNKTTV